MQRLTGLDAAFLRLETPAAHMHVMAVAVLDPRPAPEPVDARRIRRLVEDRLHLIPAFRRRLVEVPFRIHHPLWVEDPAFDLDFHVRAAALPRPGGPLELADFVGEVASRPLNRSRPLWQLWVVEGLSDGRVAVVAKVHHAAIDGASGVEVLAHLVDLEPGPPRSVTEPAPWQADRVPSDVELVAASVVSLARQPLLAARAARNLARAAVRLGRRARSEPVDSGVPFMTPRLPWNDQLTPHRRVAFADVAFDEVARVKEAFGVTVNDVVLAVVTGALRRHLTERDALPDRPLVAAVPVSVRAAHQRDAGNRVSTLFTRLPTELEDAAARLEAVAQVTRGAKRVHEDVGADTLADLTEVLAPAVLAGGARLYTQLAGRVRPVINLIVSNVPGPRVPLYLAGARLERLYPMGPVLEGVGLNVTVMSYRDAIDVGFMACRETVTDLDRLAAAVPDALAELTKAAAERGPA